MRLTIGRKLNGLIVALQLMSICGVVVLAVQLFTSDLEGLLRKGTLDTSSILATRVRAEMKHVAERARTLGAASLEDFKYPEDRLKFLQDNLAVDAQYVALSVYRRDAGGATFAPQWRIVHPEVEKRLSLKADDFKALDTSSPLDLESVSKGGVDFTVARLADGSPILRMALPFVKRSDGSFSQLLVMELQQEKLTSLFAESTSYSSFLLDSRGTVLGSTDPKAFPLGFPMGQSPVFERLRQNKDSGQIDYTDSEGETQMAGFRAVGFANLAVVTQVPIARARVAQSQLLRRTAFLAGAFLSLALALGFWFSQGITGPIRALADAARRVKDGDFSVRLPSKAKPGAEAQGDEVQQFAGTFNEMVGGLEERDRVKATFAKFHSKEMAEKVLSGELKLGGERKDATVFFSDVRGFTAMSEKMDPEQLVQILNRYMTRMVRVILEHGGIVDKYVGDAIMAVWGVPLSKDGDVERAVRACIDMRISLAELNEELINEGLPVLKIGMGLNHGPLISGNIGSEERMEFTVIGDTVNTASRIESLTKAFGTDLLVSQEVVNQCEGLFVVEKAHEAKVKGKAEALVIYKVNGTIEEGREVLVETPYSSYPAEKSDKVESTGEEKEKEKKTAKLEQPATTPATETAPQIEASELRQLWQDQAELGVVRELFGLMREGLTLPDFCSRTLEIAADLFQMNHALFLELRDGVDHGSVQLFTRAQYGASGAEASWSGQDLWDRFCEADRAEVQEFLGHQGANALLLEGPMDEDALLGGGGSDLEEEIDTPDEQAELHLSKRIVAAFYGAAPERPEVLLIPLVIRSRLYGCLAFYGSPDRMCGRDEIFLSATRFGEAVATLLEYRFMLAWTRDLGTENEAAAA
ncbi:MAG: HAMP domain-containing protein [Bdellovibrionales bacterium]|nr:HAMP domain-containing protein [Bdellovibrionales bacterium]